MLALSFASASSFMAQPLGATRCVGMRAPVTPQMGLFDGIGKAFGKAFSNNDYSQSPGLYAQTRAQARHVLVSAFLRV